jgi:alginate O-acetyltransferase complex protein AlgI
METLVALLSRVPTIEFYMSLSFWAAFAAIVVLFRLTPGRPVMKQLLILAFSVCMLLMLPLFTAASLVVFFGLCLLSYVCGAVLRTGTVAARSRLVLAATGVAAVLAILVLFKYRFVQQMIIGEATGRMFRGSDFIFLIGISYSSFKAIHFIVDSYKGAIKSARLLDYLNYMFFFPSFISGPINRFNQFRSNSSVARTASVREDLGPGLERIVHGLFKKTVLTTAVFPYTLTNMGVPVDDLHPLQMVVGLYAYAFYFYFDFSGYTDLAIGTARLMGFVLPENFDYPFLKRNIQQLWAHWHMSLTGWLTEYVYWPLVRRMRQINALRSYPLMVSNIAIVITFLICGLWHGEGANFAYWGMYQGFGIATVNLYQSWKRKVRDERALRYFRSPLSHYAGLFATFNFFAFGQALFVVDIYQVRTIVGRILLLA